MRFGARFRRYVLAATVSSWALTGGALDRVDFNTGGAGDDLEAQLEASSRVLAVQNEGETDSQTIFAAAQADYRQLLAALYDAGYYGGVISIQADGREVAGISPLRPPENINAITITVEPGPRYEFGRAVVAPVPGGTDLPDDFRTGEPARTGVIKDAAKTAGDAWREAGHPKIDLASQRITAEHLRERVDVDIKIAPGARATFGRLALVGESAVRPERIRAIAGFPEGEVYSPEAAAQVAARLRRTGAFRSVGLREAKTLNADDSLDFIATVADEAPRRIGGGAELSSVDGLTLSAYWLHRNLLGGAERLRVDGSIAQIGSDSGDDPDLRLGFRFERPALFYPDNTLVTTLAYENLEEPGYRAENYRGQIGAEWLWSDDLSFGGAVGFLISNVEEGNNVSRDFELLTLPFFVTWDKRDDTIDPSAGYFLAGTVTPFTSLGDTGGSGARLTGDARAYYGFDMGEREDRLVLAGRAQIGSVLGVDFDKIPPDFRFFSGGGGTVRGQAYQSLGFDGQSKNPTGGTGFAGLSAEARFQATDSIGVVGFADYGIVSKDSFPQSGDPDHAGVGLGVRYNTGIGPIRFDVAVPTEGDIGDFEVYIGIGQAF